MVYIGTLNDVPYAISCTGVLSDTNGELEMKRVYSIMVTTMTVRMRTGETWIHEVDYIVNFSK